MTLDRRTLLLGTAAALGVSRLARAAPERVSYAPLDRTRPVIGLYNADDCRPHGAVHADQSLRDLRAWADAWGFTKLVAIGLSWPAARSIRTGSFTSTAHGLVARTPETLGGIGIAGRSLERVLAAVNAAHPDYAAVTQSTYTPTMFAPGDRDDDLGEGCTSVAGAFAGSAARTLTFPWEYERGYERFTRTPPSLSALKAVNLVPHGRLGHPALGSHPSPLAELKLDADVAARAKSPDETLEQYYAREPLAAYCTRMARAASRRRNWDEPHVVLPNAKYWPVDVFPAIPDAANRLQKAWLRAAGVNVVDPSDGWTGYGADAARFLLVPIADASGAPMKPWRQWRFPAFGPAYAPGTGALHVAECVSERVERDGSTRSARGTVTYDAERKLYTLPTPPGDPVAGDTGNTNAYDVRIDGRHLPQPVDGKPSTAATWALAADVDGTLRVAVPAAQAGSTVEVRRSNNRSPSTYRIDAFALYVGTGSPNGPVAGAPASLYPATQNMNLRPGFHGFMWQSGTGTFAYEAFRRGATAMIGLPASPKSYMPEPQVILRNAMLTGASLGEAHMLSPARTQNEIASAGRNVSIGLTVFGDWMYAPYATA